MLRFTLAENSLRIRLMPPSCCFTALQAALAPVSNTAQSHTELLTRVCLHKHLEHDAQTMHTAHAYRKYSGLQALYRVMLSKALMRGPDLKRDPVPWALT